jgi:transposase
MTTKEVSERTGLSMQRIQQWARSQGKQREIPLVDGGRPIKFSFSEEEVEQILLQKGQYGPRPRE